MNKQATQISNPNTAGRPAGSKNKRTLIREALQQTYPDGELGFWLAVSEQAKNGDMAASAMIADRLYPKLKPQSEAVRLSEPLDGTPLEMARTLLKLMAQGEVPADTAKELIAVITDLSRVIEVKEREERSTRSIDDILGGDIF